MQGSAEYHFEWFRVDAVLCSRTIAFRSGEVDQVPGITERALRGAGHRTTRADQRHAVCAFASIRCEKTQNWNNSTDWFTDAKVDARPLLHVQTFAAKSRHKYVHKTV